MPEGIVLTTGSHVLELGQLLLVPLQVLLLLNLLQFLLSFLIRDLFRRLLRRPRLLLHHRLLDLLVHELPDLLLHGLVVALQLLHHGALGLILLLLLLQFLFVLRSVHLEFHLQAPLLLVKSLFFVVFLLRQLLVLRIELLELLSRSIVGLKLTLAQLLLLADCLLKPAVLLTLTLQLHVFLH